MSKDYPKIYPLIGNHDMDDEVNDNILKEINFDGKHAIPERYDHDDLISEKISVLILDENRIFLPEDRKKAPNIFPVSNSIHVLKSLDELLKRDERRNEDGFPKKIRLGRLIKPSPEGKNKIVVIPTVIEEKLIHDTRSFVKESTTGGSGKGEEGEIIGEEPIHTTQEGAGVGSGEGGDSMHEIESSAYDIGKILTQELKLPNIKDKGKRKSLRKYTYELTDKNRGYGQFLDKKSTLKKIIETNLSLGNIPDVHNIEPDNFLISPSDKVYRTLSKEKDYESQAVVFFVRDYSGSMNGKPTELVSSQHLLLYTWLMYQYQNNVETRFILHDTGAKEVDDFYTYYNTSVAGGTKVVSAYKLVNEIVEKENLQADYNIYVFQGTDGEDWDTDGREAIVELKKIMNYINRIGISIAENNYKYSGTSVVERYLKNSAILEKTELIRLDSFSTDANQERLIEGIKKLIS